MEVKAETKICNEKKIYFFFLFYVFVGEIMQSRVDFVGFEEQVAVAFVKVEFARALIEGAGSYCCDNVGGNLKNGL